MTTVTSIVIPTRNKAPRLMLTLAAIEGQEDLSGVEVIVVDDGSTDETTELLQASATRLGFLKVIRDTGRGRASARNSGARAAQGDMLIFLDDDVLTVPGFVSAHRDAQRRRGGLVHGRLREMIAVTRLRDPSVPRQGSPGLDPALIASRGFNPEGHRLVANALERAVELLFEGRLTDVPSWLAGAGANLSLSREVWQASSGYDERFEHVWGCEDLEFALRLHDTGIPISFAPEALGVHLSHERAGRWEEHEINLHRFAALHPRPEVRALPSLLGPIGDPFTYASEIRSLIQQRSA